MTASLKVGDRVHVEFDAVVAKLPMNPIFDFVHVRWEQDDILLCQRQVTKLIDAEPEWALGDVILVGGELLLTYRANGWVGIDRSGVCRLYYAADVRRYWENGDVQRLVPEAQK